MEQKMYIGDDTLYLGEYVDSEDNIECFNCWQDKATQDGYNFKMTGDFEQYVRRERRSRFLSTIIRRADDARIGSIFISPEYAPPDLAIMIYAPYRGCGYGTLAFSLGVRYCFEVLKLDRVYAGCYEGNARSRNMLARCGFVPHPEGDQLEKHII